MDDKNKKEKGLVPELRFPEFKDKGEWEKKPLSSILIYERPDKYIVSNEKYSNEGTPVLTANKSFILGYTLDNIGICDDLPVIIFDDFTTDKKYVLFPFKVKSSAIKILRTKNKSDNLKFIYEYMNLIKFETGEHKRYYISEYQNILFAMPPTEEQRKIADCLSSIDELIKVREEKLELLKKHKKGLMQQLFPNKTVEGRVPPPY